MLYWCLNAALLRQDSSYSNAFFAQSDENAFQYNSIYITLIRRWHLCTLNDIVHYFSHREHIKYRMEQWLLYSIRALIHMFEHVRNITKLCHDKSAQRTPSGQDHRVKIERVRHGILGIYGMMRLGKHSDWEQHLWILNIWTKSKCFWSVSQKIRAIRVSKNY